MTGFLMAALAWPPVLLLVGLLLGRLLRSADGLVEEQRTGASPATVEPARPARQTGPDRRPVPAAALGALGS